MTTQYTSILKLALPVQGELSGTWGDVVNDNITSMIEEAIAGRSVINTWTANAHTLTTADGTTSESRAAMLEFTDTGAVLSGNAEVICPTASKIYIAKNAVGSSRTVTLKTSAGTGIAIPDATTMLLFCDGTNVVEAVTNINSLSVGGYTVTLAGAVSTAAAFSTAGANALTLTTTGTTNVTLPTTGTLATLAGTETFTNKTLTSPDINGGSVDNATIGATTPSTGVFTNLTANTDLTLATGATVTGINTTTDMSDASTTTLATSDSIKQYVDAQVGANNELSEVLANGNTTGANNIIVDAGQSITTDSILETTAAAGVDIDGILLKDTSVGTDDASGTDIAGTNVTLRGGAGTGTGAGGSLIFQTAPAGSTGSTVNTPATAMTIDSTGAVDMNVSLNVDGTVTADALTVDGASTINVSDATTYLSTSRANGFLQINNTNTTSGVFSGIELIATGTGSAGAAEIICIDSGSGSGDLAFSTRNSGTWGERVRIDSSGTVIVNNGGSGNGLIKINGATGNTEALIFQRGSTEASRIGHSNSADLTFSTGSSATERMRITSAGNVGIGTSSPNANLEISGASSPQLRVTDTTNTVTAKVMSDDTSGYVGTQTSHDFSILVGNSVKATVDTSGNVGIGTASPASQVHLISANPEIRLQSSGASTTGEYSIFSRDGSQVAHKTNIKNDASSLTFGTGGNSGNSYVPTERMRIDSSGRVGIGRTPLNKQLEVEGTTSNYNTMLVADSASGTTGTGGGIGFQSDNGAGVSVLVAAIQGIKENSTSGDQSGALVFAVKSPSPHTVDEAMRIDSSGRVLVGQSSNTGSANADNLVVGTGSGNNGLTILSGTDSGGTLAFADSGANEDGFISFNQASQFMQFGTASTERMRIDASGNLLVDTTSATLYNSTSETGINLATDGGLYVAADGTALPNFNRVGSDGDIMRFRKDGTIVGSIGSVSGGVELDSANGALYLNKGNTGGLVLLNSSGSVSPRIDPDTDNLVDLGEAASRFKDLYLSGGVYVGGTGAANYLDDYEEGTWTPVLVGSTTAGTATFVTGPIGTYTKIGRLVTITFDWNISAHTGAGALRINGLPFALGTGTGVGSIMDGNYTYSSGRTKLVPYVASGSILRVYQTGDGLGYIENVLDTSHQLQGTVTYFTS